MIEIEYKERKKVDNLYNEVKNIILTKKENPSFAYDHKQHHLYEESDHPGISKGFYSESGSVEFENINGELIKLEISRWHNHRHNGWSGLSGDPCLNAAIYIKEDEEEKMLWELKVEVGTLYYKAEVSSLEIPVDVLNEKHIPSDSTIQENEVKEISKDKIENEIIQSQETRILFDEITKLCSKYKLAKQTNKELLLKIKEEIEEAIKEINKSYSIKLAQNNDSITSTQKELNDFDKLFAKYSIFDIDLVGKAIQKLISTVESEDYSYKQPMVDFTKRKHGVMDSWDESITKKVRIVVKKDKFMSCYDENNINELVKNGNALLLDEQNINIQGNNKLTVYTSRDGQVSCHVDFGRFDYIKKFIDSIVQYRFQNDMIEFTEKDMIEFTKKFLIEHEDKIVENCCSRIKERILSL